jgi:hypothetical protein
MRHKIAGCGVRVCSDHRNEIRAIVEERMVGISPGWAIELIGSRIDLDDFRLALKAPFSPWIEDYSTAEGTVHLLRSKNWEKLAEASHVFRDATRMIERLNGEALLLDNDAQPVKLGKIMKFDANGKRESIVFAITGELRVTLGNARAKARRIFVNDGPPPPPEESNTQRWCVEADNNEILSNLFSHLTRADNWFDLYKSAELLRRLAKGERSLKKILSSDWKKWELVWRTANCHRHAPDPIKYPWPPSPADLKESRQFILSIIPRLLT